jgi:hypothetical protein
MPMSDSLKKQIGDVHVSILPEEIDTIFGLKNTYDYFEIFGNYVSSYLELGWNIKLIIPHLDIVLDVDFSQDREVWNQGLTDLAVKGISISPVVCTGSASNLMVLEVHGKNAEKALVLGRDWRAKCVIQIGEDSEQHFFTWPQSILLPDQAIIETLDIKVFGEGGKVPLPPSPVPGDKDPVRWLVPPWESSPSPPASRLLEFLRRHIPVTELEDRQGESDILPWEEIFTRIASHARLMQTLLTPVTKSEDYYRSLLQEARASGLQDQRLLLGLLWHAPLGQSRHELNSLEWFKDLIKENDQDEILDPRQMQGQLTGLIKELSKTLTELKERENLPKDNCRNSSSCPPQEDHCGGENKSQPIVSKHTDPEQVPRQNPSPKAYPEGPSEGIIDPSILPPAETQFKRKQNGAMIDELGKSEGKQGYPDRIIPGEDGLKAKIEAQRQEDINHLRQLAREKKNRKWW